MVVLKRTGCCSFNLDGDHKPLEQNQMISYCYTSASHWRDDFMVWCPNNVLAIWSLWSPSILKLQQPVLFRTTIYIIGEIFIPFTLVYSSMKCLKYLWIRIMVMIIMKFECYLPLSLPTGRRGVPKPVIPPHRVPYGAIHCQTPYSVVGHHSQTPST